jgi:hypothetical protein
MEDKNPANHVFIYGSPKSQVDLLGDPGTSPGWIALFHFNDCPDQICRWTFWSRLGHVLWRKQQTILFLYQRTMEIQERRRLEGNGHPAKPTWLDPKGTESADQPIENPEIRCTAARTIQNQQLMFCQNGFRHDSAHTSGLDQPDHRRDEMDYKNNQIAHEEWYSGPQTTEVGANLEFATDTKYYCAE